MATLKDKLGIPESYDAFDISVYCLQCTVYGIVWGFAYLSLAGAVLLMLYNFIYLPLSWVFSFILAL